MGCGLPGVWPGRSWQAGRRRPAGLRLGKLDRLDKLHKKNNLLQAQLRVGRRRARQMRARRGRWRDGRLRAWRAAWGDFCGPFAGWAAFFGWK